MRPLRVALPFPPQWTATQPPFAFSSLNGQLRRSGHEISIRDLNLEFIEELLSEQGIGDAGQRLRAERDLLGDEAFMRLAMGDRSERLSLVGARLAAIKSALERHDDAALAARAGDAIASFRDEEAFYDPERLVRSMRTLDEALKFYSAPFYPSEIRWNDFASPACPLNLEPILEFCRSTVDNPFRSFYEPRLARILDERPHLISISIGSFSQVLPGLTLAGMLREELGESSPVHLNLGGNFFSRLREPLRRRPEFFAAFADSLVVGEGERPMPELARALAAGERTLESVPNLLFLDADGSLQGTAAEPNFRMEELAFQDFSGFPLDRYLAPERVVCIRASKGCYWGRCTFCDSHYGLSPDSIAVGRLVEEIRYLRDRYGVRHFEFIDECMSPSYLAAMSDAFIREDLGVRWFCNARTEPEFTPKLFSRMSRAGATMILWGIESGSRRLLHLMHKGVSPAERLGVLRSASEAGLWNFAYVFFGFPSETNAEAESTIDLICENTGVIHSYGQSRFTLGRHSPLMAAPEKNGILKWFEDDLEFSTNIGFDSEGIQGAELSGVMARCTTRCRQAYGDPLWMMLRTRENLHLYLARYGADQVRNTRVAPPERSGESGKACRETRADSVSDGFY